MAFQIPVYGEVLAPFNPSAIKVTDESQDVNYNSTSPVTIGTVLAGKKIVILGVIMNVKTIWAGTGPTLAVGISGTVDKYATTAQLVTTAVKILTVWSAAQTVDAGAADLPIIVTIGGTGLSAGKSTFRLIYVDLEGVSQ